MRKVSIAFASPTFASGKVVGEKKSYLYESNAQANGPEDEGVLFYGFFQFVGATISVGADGVGVAVAVGRDLVAARFWQIVAVESILGPVFVSGHSAAFQLQDLGMIRPDRLNQLLL